MFRPEAKLALSAALLLLTGRFRARFCAAFIRFAPSSFLCKPRWAFISWNIWKIVQVQLTLVMFRFIFRLLLLRTEHADVGLETLTEGATTRDYSIEKLNPSITTTTGWKTHEIHQSLGNNQFQERLQQTIAQCPFQGNQTEMQAYKAMLQEELQEGIIEEIPKEQVKWWNPTFLVPKPSGECRKILDASLLNEEIQPLHFQMNGVEQVRYLLIPNDWAVTLDLKSAFHHLIVYPPHRAYLAFEVDNHHYQYGAMPFGCKHSPIFFTQALTILLTEIHNRTDIRIINYSDDLLLLHQDKNWLFYQTQHIINTLEHFGWTIALNKCQLIPKQEIDFLGWNWNMIEMNIFMTKDRRHQLIDQVKQFIKNTQRHKIIKIKETAALIGRLNFLRTQFREASLYLMLINSAKTRAVKTQGWTGMMVSPLEALKDLYWWIKKITENKKQQIQDPIPQATVVTDASPQGWGATLELDSGEVLVAHGAWLSYQIHWTSNRKELQAIHL
ncbi:MAG: putative Transposon Ty3-G Gag-Pol polyprotein, partial [Streblomastix strix]